jgi:hypothetical protein
MSGAMKSNRELATELTMSVVKAKANIICSIEGNNQTKTKLMEELLNDSQITETFNKVYATISEKL